MLEHRMAKLILASRPSLPSRSECPGHGLDGDQGEHGPGHGDQGEQQPQAALGGGGMAIRSLEAV